MDLLVFLRIFNFFHLESPGNESLVQHGNTSRRLETVNLTPISSSFSVDPQKENVVHQIGEDCRGVYGCFPISDPWEGPERPVSLPPKSVDEINPFFCLYSRHNHQCLKFFPSEMSRVSQLDISSESHLIIITHGFMKSAQHPWVVDMVLALLHNLEGNIRVVTLDWSLGSLPPYAQAVANTRIVGAIVGRLIEVLVKTKGLKLSHIHLVGHSLGAHLFGYAGSYIIGKKMGKVGRITGMDPAGPYFQGTPPQVRLEYSDAFLVDIIHTDSTSLIPSLPVSLGNPEASGHLDFFPNGGGEQRGCRKSPQSHFSGKRGLRDGVLEFMGCNHETSHRYLTSSLRNRCNYIGVECASWKQFKEGGCWNCSEVRCFKMGFDVARVYPREGGQPEGTTPPEEDFYGVVVRGETKLELFLTTTTNENLCGEQLRFTLRLSDSKSAKEQGGEYAKLRIVVRGHNGTVQTDPRKESVHLNPGDELQWVDAVPSTIGKIHSVVVTFQEEEELLIFNPVIFRITPPTIYLKDIVIQSLLGDFKMKFESCQEKFSVGETIVLKEKCQPKYVP